MERTARTFVAAFAALTLLFAAFVSGAALERYVGFDTFFGADVPPPETETTDIVREVVDIIRREALEPASEESMTAGAVNGLLGSLDDPYAAYFDAEQYGYFQEQNHGEFYGIGITVTERDGKAIVVSTIEDTPAEAAGLQPEDEIVSVDGYSPERWTLDDVVARIRGEEGTPVTLEIRREGEEELIEVTIVRARIEVPNIMTELLEDDIGYMRLLTFNTHAARDIRNAVEDLSERGAEGFILDLRDNPGGLLQSSVEVASLFVEEGLIVRVEERDGHPEEHFATGRTVTDAPLVVLVNENSASAAEIVAGALQDHGRAKLVGETTFGKGSVQTVEELSNGGAVKITTAHYLTPSGRSIHKVGLTPDVRVEMKPADQRDRDTDVQLSRAIEVLRGEMR
ncbi:MAG: S41 family peptidase [Coriobacteriia bacterium]